MLEPIQLHSITQALESQYRDTETYLDLRTGEIIFVSQIGDFEDPPGSDPEEMRKLREEGECPGFGLLPDSFEIDESRLMCRFVGSVDDKDQAPELLDALRGSGAFRRFRDRLREIGLLESWYAFRHNALEDLARDWLEENEVPFVDDSGKA